MPKNVYAAHGYVQVSTVSPWMRPGAVQANLERILEAADAAYTRGNHFVLFPELCFTGYTAMDLFNNDLLLSAARRALHRLVEASDAWPGLVVLVGLPWQWKGHVFNTCAVVQSGQLLGLVPKTFLPNTHEFQEARWFTAATLLPAKGVPVSFAGRTVILGQQLFEVPLAAEQEALTFAVEICQDLWSVDPPSTRLALEGASLIFNLSASSELVGKHPIRRRLVQQHSERLLAGYVYTASGPGESTNDLVFSGTRLIAEAGEILIDCDPLTQLHKRSQSSADPRMDYDDALIDMNYLRRRRQTEYSYRSLPLERSLPVTSCNPFSDQQGRGTLTRLFPQRPFITESASAWQEEAETALSLQARGLATRMEHSGIEQLVLGISGGLDSTLALLVCLRAVQLLDLPPHHITGVTMPGPGTTEGSYQRSLALMQQTGIRARDIAIHAAVAQHLQDLDHDPELHDTTYENAQARERTQLLMDIANQEQGLVVGTGSLSELALGWCTYNGDQMSMYAVNSSVPKTMVNRLVHYEAERLANQSTDSELPAILHEILEQPYSPELLPTDGQQGVTQVTEDAIGPYVLHDFFLYHMLYRGKSPATLRFLATESFRPGVGDESYTAEEIEHWLRIFLRRFFSQQFKRTALPDGPKVTAISLSPRGDWRMPSDASSADWLQDLAD